jgi:hypothetical protein
MHYKAPDNSLHFLYSSDHEYLLPAGSVQITDAEAESLRPQPPAPTYRELRAAEYPSFADQFDLLYHGGLDAWKDAIDVVKNKYPKV